MLLARSAPGVRVICSRSTSVVEGPACAWARSAEPVTTTRCSTGLISSMKCKMGELPEVTVRPCAASWKPEALTHTMYSPTGALENSNSPWASVSVVFDHVDARL